MATYRDDSHECESLEDTFCSSGLFCCFLYKRTISGVPLTERMGLGAIIQV